MEIIQSKVFDITVVVPIYNCAPYLRSLISGLEAQTFKNFSCIFVCDVSTDGSIELLSKSLKSSSLIAKLYIKKEKEGVGKARDYVLDNKLLNTEYVLFLDSDDLFSPTFFEELFAKAKSTKADIVMCGFSRVDYETKKTVSIDMIHNPDEILVNEGQSLIPFLAPAVWDKLYEVSIIQDARFEFRGGGEDEMFFLSLLPRCKKIAFVNKPLYTYFLHANSVSDKTNVSLLETAKNGYLLVLNGYKKNHYDEIGFVPLLEATVFFRIGIGLTTRTCLRLKIKERKIIIKSSMDYFDQYFNGWRKNRFLSFRSCAKRGAKGTMIWGCRLLYKLHLFSFFVFLYSSFTKIFKKDIKW